MRQLYPTSILEAQQPQQGLGARAPCHIGLAIYEICSVPHMRAARPLAPRSSPEHYHQALVALPWANVPVWRGARLLLLRRRCVHAKQCSL